MGRKIEHLGDLRQDPANARRHNPRNVGLIVDALQEVGAARSGVIDEDGTILAGNATWEALAEAGIERVKVVEADGNEWVVVQRKGLSEAQKVRLALFDNRAAELAEWSPEMLAAIAERDPAAVKNLWTDAELAILIAGKQEGDFDPMQEWQGMPEFEQEDLTSFQKVVVHFANGEAVRAFAELVGQNITDVTKAIWYPKQERITYGEARES